jgi:bifunctional non-homologous end joining protein LigD
MDEDGAPSFDHLHSRSSKSLAVVVFDVLWLDGEDLRPLPLSERRKRLGPLIDTPSALVIAETFDDPLALLAACEAHKLEGIVSKRVDQPYRSGTSHGWIKVKTEAWHAFSRGRRKQFAQ